jgi:curved DNA-binding protein CbpA
VAEILALIAGKLKEVDADVDHYTLLGVPRDAPGMAVRSAYFELAKNLHPDRLQALGITDMPQDAQRLFARINQAFAVLGNAGKRAEYNQALERGTAHGSESKKRDEEEYAVRLVAAEQHFLRGEMAIRHNQIATALAEFEKAAELNPDEAEHHALLAWARWCAASDKNAILAEVKKGFTRAITLSPKNVAAYFYRGQVCNSAGDIEGALECFQKVLRYQPGHREAGLQARLLESRIAKGEGDKKSEKKGLLDRLKRR